MFLLKMRIGTCAVMGLRNGIEGEGGICTHT
jgi:hypothetical protein